MEQISKTFLGIIILLLVTFSGVGIISASIDAAHAEEYASDVASVIEASNYSNNVIQICKDKAAEAGYTLEVTLKDIDNDGHNDMAEVIVNYKYTIAILNITGTEHQAKAFSR